MRGLAVVALVSGGLWLSGPAQAQDRAAAAEHFDAGVALAGQRRWSDAEERFRAALAIEDTAIVRYDLALVLYEQGEHAEADTLSRGIAADRAVPAELRRRATALRESWQRAGALFAQGLAAAERQSWRTAEARFREALAVRDSPAVRYNLAVARFERGDRAEARTLATTVAADAQAPEAVRELARGLLARFGRAGVLFDEAMLHARRGEWADAEAKLREARAIEDAPATRYNLAVALARQGELTEAEALAQGVAADETAPPGVRALATEFAQDSERARALFTEGVAHSDARRWPEAEASFRAALALRLAPAITVNLGTAVFEQGRFAEAMLLTDRVMEAPEATPRLRQLALLLRGQIEAAAGFVRVARPGPGARLVIDGLEIPERWGDDPVPVPVGAHRVAHRRDGRDVAVAEVTVAAVGDTTTAELEPVATPVAPPDPVDEPPPVEAPVEPVAPPLLAHEPGDPLEEGGTPLVRDYRLWVGVALGVLCVVLVIAVAADPGDDPAVRGNLGPGVLEF